MIMQATGTVYLAKARPVVTTAADGTFVLTLLAYDRLAHYCTTPWRISYSGPQAQAFWAATKDQLQPGQPLRVTAQRIQAHALGRNIAPEVMAVATHIDLAPRASGAALGLTSTRATQQQQHPESYTQ